MRYGTGFATCTFACGAEYTLNLNPKPREYTALQDNYVLDQIRAKDLIVLQNYPQPVVHPPQKPAPPWTTTPHAPHGRTHRLAPVNLAAASEPAFSTQRQVIGGLCPCQSVLLNSIRSFGLWAHCVGKVLTMAINVVFGRWASRACRGGTGRPRLLLQTSSYRPTWCPCLDPVLQAVQREELLSGVEAYQPLFRDAPELLRIYETVARRFRDRTHFDLY